MGWRVIIRFSLDNDTKSTVRNAIEGALRECGIVRSTTGTWESRFADPVECAQSIGKLLDHLANPSGVSGVSPDFMLDHLWIYVDRGESKG
jgi:hypothetical protein